ncbi:16S rRNA-processing protein RimM [Salinisphaera sp. PC39]|uniref:ribosome maturation factor RimM n=1 Tax=Salinisphaera sp. PC39 TaxID=1304156 RepID=UPI003340C8EC
MTAGSGTVLLGRINGLFGVRGWVKVYSYTDPAANILDFPLWHVGRDGESRPMRLVEGRVQGKGLVARLAPADGDPIDDRDEAAALVGCDIAVDRDDLPPLPEGEYYWADLLGLRVVNREGDELGTVSHMMDTGVHGVLVVNGERERLIPFVPGVIVDDVDLAAGRITVDWLPDW